ncbi:hypothetical protein I551_1424 [Mycobacterium ulcerans str. Harvey]|uniref:Uncharacterized protein n=1 Tax=Mycobacterium ulcerans str. Harvey TaxID=1299332 RepID=A0ABN0R4Z5_MYCUL|nr:hypothetical protein I551_1424 [Mycobacterium ulcerans str. Harvey]
MMRRSRPRRRRVIRSARRVRGDGAATQPYAEPAQLGFE